MAHLFLEALETLCPSPDGQIDVNRVSSLVLEIGVDRPLTDLLDELDQLAELLTNRFQAHNGDILPKFIRLKLQDQLHPVGDHRNGGLTLQRRRDVAQALRRLRKTAVIAQATELQP
jgi:hypothetical protein